MDSKQYLVALEISSSKIVGVLCEPNSKGGVDVVDIEAERSLNCVRWGCVQNVEETKLRVNRVISRLENNISPNKIVGVYVGINGRSLHNHAMNISTTFDDERMITESVIDALKDRFYSESDVQGDILDLLPCQYFVDNRDIVMPIGTYGTSISVQFNGVVAKNALKMNINRALDAQYAIKGYIVTQLAMAEHVLTREERQLGCMLVDFGAEVTTVTIFRRGVLKYLATLPMGSQLITRDLTNLNMLEDAAEEIKKTSGNAIASTSTRSILVEGVPVGDVQNYVVARCEEIVANINEQINYSGLSRDEIAAGIVLVGGGSQLNGFNRLVEDMTKLKVRFGSIPATVTLQDRAARGIEYLQVISIAAAAAGMMKAGDSCVQAPVPVVEEQPIMPEDIDDEVEEEEAVPMPDDEEEKPIQAPKRRKKHVPVEEVEEDDVEEINGENGKKKKPFSGLFDQFKSTVVNIFVQSEDAYNGYDDNDDSKNDDKTR